MGLFGYNSYAQHGEDFMLLNLIGLLDIPKARYLDLGAHHPEIDSNTKLLYDRGHRGINVEANPNLIHSFYGQRQQDINLNYGVGLEKGEKPFYMVDKTSGLNSFCLEEIERVGRKVTEITNLPVLTPKDIFHDVCKGVWPDVLLTDLEGLDFLILEKCTKLFDGHNRPRIVCSEVRPHDGNIFKSLLKWEGYFSYCRLAANLIFVLESDREKLY